MLRRIFLKDVTAKLIEDCFFLYVMESLDEDINRFKLDFFESAKDGMVFVDNLDHPKTYLRTRMMQFKDGINLFAIDEMANEDKNKNLTRLILDAMMMTRIFCYWAAWQRKDGRIRLAKMNVDQSISFATLTLDELKGYAKEV